MLSSISFLILAGRALTNFLSKDAASVTFQMPVKNVPVQIVLVETLPDELAFRKRRMQLAFALDAFDVSRHDTPEGFELGAIHIVDILLELIHSPGMPLVDFLEDVDDELSLVFGEEATVGIHAVSWGIVSDVALFIAFIMPCEIFPAGLLIEEAYQFHDGIIHAGIHLVVLRASELWHLDDVIAVKEIIPERIGRINPVLNEISSVDGQMFSHEIVNMRVNAFQEGHCLFFISCWLFKSIVVYR